MKKERKGKERKAMDKTSSQKGESSSLHSLVVRRLWQFPGGEIEAVPRLDDIREVNELRLDDIREANELREAICSRVKRRFARNSD